MLQVGVNVKTFFFFFYSLREKIFQWSSSDSKGRQRHECIQVAKPKLYPGVGRWRWKTKAGSVCELIASLHPKRFTRTPHLRVGFCHFCIKKGGTWQWREIPLGTITLQPGGPAPFALTRYCGFYFRSVTITKNTPHQQVQERFGKSNYWYKAALLFLLTAVQTHHLATHLSPAVSLPEIWSGLKLNELYCHFGRMGFFFY